MAQALASPDRAYLFIGGAVRSTDGMVVLCRGNHERLEVPLAYFGEAETPGTELEVLDGGQSIALGGRRADAEAILLEFDPTYRAWAQQPPKA